MRINHSGHDVVSSQRSRRWTPLERDRKCSKNHTISIAASRTHGGGFSRDRPRIELRTRLKEMEEEESKVY